MSSTSQYDLFNSNIHKILTVQENMSYGTSENSYKKYNIFSSIIKAKKIHILYAYTGDQNKNAKRWVLGGGGLRSESGNFWRQCWQVKSLNLSPPNSDLPCVTSLFSRCIFHLPLCHMLTWQAQSLSVAQPMPLQAAHSAWLGAQNAWE